jgi:trimethylamine--corrinoid protein Co-methyltransferase
MATGQECSQTRPVLEVLGEDLVHRIVAEAQGLLETRGVTTSNRCALERAAEHGLAVDMDRGQVRMGEDTVRRCLESAPSRLELHSRSGEMAMVLAGVRPHFNPGSAAISILDPGATQSRKPLIADCIRLAQLTAALPHLSAQATGLVPTDVPREHADWSRLLVALLYCEKPVVTGTFGHGSLAVMRELMLAIRGTDAALREQPLAIVDCCPSPPLRWGDHIIQDVLDAACWGIPIEFVSMPAMGSVGPVTMVGSLIQHTAETLSGVVFSQLAAPGAPVIYGGSPSLFDMRCGTTPMGAIESMIVMCATAQIGRHLGLPTHAYLGLSDSKVVDAQAGAETSLGAVLGALAGVNNMSGPGMLELESCFSLEKLVIDNDVCGMALRAAEGVAAGVDDFPAAGVFDELLAKGHLLTSEHTLRHYREHFYPETLDRDRRENWAKRGGRDAGQHAAARVEELLRSSPPALPERDTTHELARTGRAAAGHQGLPHLPGVT